MSMDHDRHHEHENEEGAPKRYLKVERSRGRFCRDKVEPDYKDIASLFKLASPQGKIFSRKRSGNCARHQNRAKQAFKRARYMAILSYVGNEAEGGRPQRDRDGGGRDRDGGRDRGDRGPREDRDGGRERGNREERY